MMKASNAQVDITPQVFSQNMGALKRRLAQSNGEAAMLANDNLNQFIETILNMVNQVFAQSNSKDVIITDTKAKLEKVYNAHPELKIAEEQAAKDAEAKAKKGTAKKV